ncbi:multicopper oxidase [Xylaria arbuscula]|nr:multicopper oxidase [Xylaria arbuscula]
MHNHRNILRPADSWYGKLWADPSRFSSIFVPAKSHRQRTVPLCHFIITLIFLCVAALALGLGLGLGWRRYGIMPAAASLFEYSSYGIADDALEVIPPEQLVNTKELSLDTGFDVSDQPITREYVFNISLALAAPDGLRKPMILANGQSPGPLIEANTGDTIRVHVNNLMSNWSTSIHWHGIDQRNTTWMDGVVGVSQCGIPPGHSFTYEFRVGDQRGTFWWHAHLSVQYFDGLYGPLVIHDPSELVPKTDDEKIIFLRSSYLNSTSKWVPFESGVEPLPDNILLNGQNTYDCAVESTTYPPQKSHESSAPSSTSESKCTRGQLYTTKIRTGQHVRLRVINSSSFLSYWISIDNHTLSIVELDGIEIAPIAARGVYLNIGQRASIIITADQSPGNYYIRATLPETCFLPYVPYTSDGLAAGDYTAKGILSYDDVPVGVASIGTMGNVSNPYGVENNGVRGDVWEGCDDMPFDMPKPMRQTPAYDVPESNKHYIEYMFRQAQDVNRIFINKTAYAPLPDNATLWKAIEQQFVASKANSYNSWDFGLNQQVLLIPEAEKGAQIVINSRDAMEHPWHLHGDESRSLFLRPWSNRKHRDKGTGMICPHFDSHTFQIVGWGPGLFGTSSSNGTTTLTTWNLANPMRRDTVTVPAFSHVVIRFETNNPGLWALHCHVAWHMEGGMFVSLAERPDDLVRLVEKMDPATRALSQSFCGATGGSSD